MGKITVAQADEKDFSRKPEEALANERPASPCCIFGHKHGILALPVKAVAVNVECHISTAFVKLSTTFVNTHKRKTDVLFAVPLKGTVTSVSVTSASSDRVIDTAVISNDDAGKYDAKETKSNIIPQDQPLSKSIPDLFRLPIPSIAKREVFKVEICYIEPLQFYMGNYRLSVPLSFNPALLPSGSLNNIIQIQCAINCIVPNVQYNSQNYQIVLMNEDRLHLSLQAQPASEKPSDFDICYFMPSPTILAGLIKEDGDPHSIDKRGSFVLFVTPPSNVLGCFPRNIVFLMDRSGSMAGTPFSESLRAFEAALHNLKPQDRFALIAFDHEMTNYNNGQLISPTPDAIASAMSWMTSHHPRGCTDIDTPLTAAIEMLNSVKKENAEAGYLTLSFVILLTDGCVNGERELVTKIRDIHNEVRVFTYGIGPYCNWYFLKMLAQVSRGFHTSVLQPNDIYEKMVRLMDMASNPVLSDVTLVMAVSNCEIYPYPIPDLFLGGPLTISGKFDGAFPDSIMLQGRLFNGQQFQQEVITSFSPVIPAHMVFIRQRLELLTAKYWLEQNEDTKHLIVDLSCENSIPTAYTSMVAYETSVKAKEENDKDKKRNKIRNNKNVATLALGGVFVLGVAVYSFGDIAASASNLSSVGDAVSGLVDTIGDIDCCGDIDCGDIACCDCGDISCGDCECGGCEEIGEACEGIGKLCKCMCNVFCD